MILCSKLVRNYIHFRYIRRPNVVYSRFKLSMLTSRTTCQSGPPKYACTIRKSNG